VGRGYVLPDDVKHVVAAVLEHRLLLAPAAAMRGTSVADILDTILSSVRVPGTRPR
jgi:MoxR-like ATPase